MKGEVDLEPEIESCLKGINGHFGQSAENLRRSSSADVQVQNLS